jgi:methionyl-tRNA formyltransferase
MRIVILTQDDPFFLPKALDKLQKEMPAGVDLIATVLFEVSPFGKRESFFAKMKKTWDVFGFEFFLFFSLKFLLAKIKPGYSVKAVLKKAQVPLLQLDGAVNAPHNLAILADLKPDLFVSIGGNQIFKRPLLDIPTNGCINLHTALLPKYRGLMPSFWVLKNQEKYTGISVFMVDEGIDSGPLVVQKKIEIGNRTQEELITYTKDLGMDCILEAICLIRDGKVVLMPNPKEEMTYFSFPTSKDVLEFKRNGAMFFKWF